MNTNERRLFDERLQIQQSPSPMHLIRTLLIGLIVSQAASALGAESEAGARRVMTLEDCVQSALEHNLGLQIARYNPLIARYTLNAIYGGYDPAFSLSGEHDYSLSPGGVDAQGRPFQGTESESDRLSSGFQGTLPWGLFYNVGGSLVDRVDTRTVTIANPAAPQTYFTNIVYDAVTGAPIVNVFTNSDSISIRTPFENTSGNLGFLQLRQPVLKNFWIDSTRLNIAVNKRNLRISELDLRTQIMNVVTTVEQAYYNLIFAYENVKVQEKALELAVRLQEENKKKVEVGALAPLDEKQAEAQVAQSRADLLSAKNTLSMQQNLLKSTITDDYKSLHDSEIVPAESLLAVPQTFNLQESWEKGLTLRPDMVQARLNLEKQGYVVRFQKNQLFPQLDLIGTYGYSASAKEFSGALDGLRRGDSPFYSAGAQVTVPLGNTGARNNYKVAKATKDQLALQVKALEQTIMVSIDDALKRAQSDFERVSATHQARLYQEAALDAEQKKLENGKSTSFQVLIIQRDLTTAASQEIRALADYNHSLAQLALAEATTLDRRHINVETK